MARDEVPQIVIARERVPADVLRTLVERHFEDMVKYVVDVRRGILAVGGEMHVDAEGALLDDGSEQEDLWGANYRPGLGHDDCIEYVSLINIRPARGNRSMRVEDPAIRERIRSLTSSLLGRGEPL